MKFVIVLISAAIATAQAKSLLRSKKNRALALGGGGFLAHSAYTGMAAHPDLKEKFKDIDLISSSSGGSWFLSSLAYSTKFAELVESIGESPNDAEVLFQSQWVDPFVGKASKGEKELPDGVLNLMKVVVPDWVDDFKMLAGYGMKNGKVDFNNVVASILNVSDIDKSVRTNSPVADWASGKTWLAGATVAADATLWGKGSKYLKYKSVLPDGKTAPPKGHYPARFTVGLGISPPSNKFCYACGDLRLEYKGVYKCAFLNIGCEKYTITSQPLGTDVDASDMPLYMVASASSSFLGGLTESGLVKNFKNDLFVPGGEFMPLTLEPHSDKPSEDDILEKIGEENKVTAQRLSAVKASKMQAVFDAGYADNSGIGNAVAAGYDDIVVWDQGTGMGCPPEISNLFAGGEKYKDAGLGMATSFFQIFSSPSKDAFCESYSNTFKQLDTSGVVTKYLEGIKVGTIEATTAENAFFGIKGGRKVKLHIVYVGSTLNMGLGKKFSHFSNLVAEVTQTLRENKYDALSSF